jgi:hypothetical protein
MESKKVSDKVIPGLIRNPHLSKTTGFRFFLVAMRRMATSLRMRRIPMKTTLTQRSATEQTGCLTPATQLFAGPVEWLFNYLLILNHLQHSGE